MSKLGDPRLYTQITPLIDKPPARVAVDIIGPLPISERGSKYIVTMVDYATRFPEAKALLA